MKIVLFGSTGQIGSSLLQNLSTSHIVVADHFEDKRINLSNMQDVKIFLNNNPADLYINAAAYTDVDAAEINKEKCFAVNSKFIEYLSHFLKNLNKPLIHFSSDYVYGSNDSEYLKESYELNPLNYYAFTKKLAEDLIVRSLNYYFIFRISWIYSNIRKNFYKTIKKISLEKTEISLVDDQWGAPTPAHFIAETITNLINKNMLHNKLTGIYNLAPSNFTNWYGFAYKILFNYQKSNFSKINLIPIKTKDYITKATRQKNSKLDCNKFINTFNLQIPHWEYLFNEHEKRNF